MEHTAAVGREEALGARLAQLHVEFEAEREERATDATKAAEAADELSSTIKQLQDTRGGFLLDLFCKRRTFIA